MASSSVLDRFIISFVICLCILAACFKVKAATLPPGFTETQIAAGLSNPTAMEFAPDGRWFVCQQGGQLRVIKNGVLLATPFVSLTVDASGERGLLGIAFDPNFAANNFIYLYYTPGGSSPRNNRVSRFTANGDVAVANSESVILTLDNLSSATNHNGGAIHFGPDGKLYVAVGENANGANSQTLTNRLGKMLRINSDGSIPTDNPFFNTAPGLNRSIWSLGLRNPYTFAFQRNTGRMFINDVGQSTWEEINDGIAGSNYGWPTTEGPTNNPNFRAPIFAYGRAPSSTGGCAITGGAFYDPATTQFPVSYFGKYFFADFCSGWIRLLDPATNTATDFAAGINSPVDLRVTLDGSLYYLARGAGAVFRIQYPPNQQQPGITTHPSNQNVTEGQPATFSVIANGTAPLTYQWQRNTVPISGANSPSYTISTATSADNGAKFRCVVSNAFGTATSNEATLTVTPPPPTLMTEVGSDRAIAFDSVTMMRDPFPLFTAFNFSSDHRTRIILFALNADLLPGENSSALTAQAEDSILVVYPLTVEFVGKVPGFDSITQIVVKLPESISGNGDVLVNVTLHGKVSNKVRIKIR
jgi:glucose/arabinose dehydrogenase